MPSISGLVQPPHAHTRNLTVNIQAIIYIIHHSIVTLCHTQDSSKSPVSCDFRALPAINPLQSVLFQATHPLLQPCRPKTLGAPCQVPWQQCRAFWATPGEELHCGRCIQTRTERQDVPVPWIFSTEHERNGPQPSGFKTLGLTPHGGRGSFAGLATWESVQRACFSCRHLHPCFLGVVIFQALLPWIPAAFWIFWMNPGAPALARSFVDWMAVPRWTGRIAKSSVAPSGAGWMIALKHLCSPLLRGMVFVWMGLPLIPRW